MSDDIAQVRRELRRRPTTERNRMVKEAIERGVQLEPEILHVMMPVRTAVNRRLKKAMGPLGSAELTFMLYLFLEEQGCSLSNR